MLGSVMLEVAIGLVFIYGFLSVLCSGITEIVSWALSRRASHLEAALVHLLDARDAAAAASSPPPAGHTPAAADPATKAPGDKIDEQAPVAAALVAHPLIDQLSAAGKVPGYIPARTFATALLDVVLIRGAQASAEVRALPSYEQVRDAVIGLGDDRLKQALLPLLARAEKDVGAFRTQLEGWFDDAMTRVSGAFKRWTMGITLAIAVIVCGALNADTFAMMRHLSVDTEARKALVAQAEQRVREEVDSEAQLDGTGKAKLASQKLGAAMSAGLPLGWDAAGTPREGGEILYKILGIVVTSLGVSLGAPFWFDLLGKLVNLRINGAKPKSGKTGKPRKT
jgi:hypothetical protein